MRVKGTAIETRAEPITRSSDLETELWTIAATFAALGVTPGKVKALWVDLRQHDWAFQNGRIHHEDCGRTGTLVRWLKCAKDEGEFVVFAHDGVPCAVVEWLPNYAERVVIAVTDSMMHMGD
jgi:hypothetical protein